MFLPMRALLLKLKAQPSTFVRRPRRKAGVIAAFCLLLAIFCPAVSAQVSQMASRPALARWDSVPSPWVDTKPLTVDTGTTGLKLMLRRLHTTARLMQTVAHPDDEDGSMLTLESRGHGASVLLLTLNRGEGGQNKLGSNLFDELGIIRTLELLSADRYYHVEQRFTRVADFGFSKTAEETFQKWGGHDTALADMVRVIRTFRPDVICSRFQGTARDGHGHHQASGILTREAFRAAADPRRFPEQIRAGLQPWQAKKLYIDNVRPDEDWTVKLESSQYDPLLGETYAQFAWKGLQHQRSQGAGAWTFREGQRFSYYKLIDSAGITPPAAGAHENDFFDGIDTSLPGLAARLGADEAKVPWLRAQLRAIARSVDEATAAADKDPQSAGVPLLRGRKLTRALIARVSASALSGAEKADLLASLRTKQEQFQQAANLALGLELQLNPGTPDGRPLAASFSTEEGDVLAAVITAGKPFLLRATLHNGSSAPIDIRQFALIVPPGWKSGLFLDKMPKQIPPGEGCALTFRVSPPLEARPTQQYFHRDDPERDAIYTIDEAQYATLPLPPPPVWARVEYGINAAQPHSRPSTSRRTGSGGANGRPGLEGEIDAVARTPVHDDKGHAWSMPLAVVPPFSVAAVPPTQIILAGKKPSAKLSVVVRTTADRGSGVVRPEMPKGWAIEPQSAKVTFTEPGHRDADFQELPDGAGEARYDVRALLSAAGRHYSQAYSLVARPDIGGFFYYHPTLQRASIVRVKVPPGLKVGYIMGAGDDIPQVLREVGLDVTLLTPDDVAHGDLDSFGTIVLGIRAYDTREDVRKNNQRLLDYVKNGGTLLVQYNTLPRDFNAGDYTPYPAELSRERVTVEQAPVTFLAPQDPVFHYPNQITERDFDGWIQERGLYFMDQWDPHYTPLLACNDPGQEPQKGGLLVAQYGKGHYIYTGYAFFRQLPFGVPGAIRFYVNLLSVGHELK
ncbi:MAG TPA: PIG-L family deacetylase [Terriglobales bacterium]|nr:PIG-L family deacetylase [Terriglobales bacterium]